MEVSAFNRIVMPVRDKLYRLGLTLLQNREDAEDALQETLLKLWKNKHLLYQIDNHEAYAMKMMKNLCLDKLKYQKGKKLVALPEHRPEHESLTPFASVSFNNLKELMQKLFSTLPEQQRLIIHMRDIEHCSYEDIEAVTGMTVNAIRVNLSRARKTVRSSYVKIKMYENG
jgi:RNA polymerase sigma-70 factor (ECF subfamily)